MDKSQMHDLYQISDMGKSQMQVFYQMPFNRMAIIWPTRLTVHREPATSFLTDLPTPFHFILKLSNKSNKNFNNSCFSQLETGVSFASVTAVLYPWQQLPQVLPLSRQKFCHNKYAFVTTKSVFLLQQKYAYK